MGVVVGVRIGRRRRRGIGVVDGRGCICLMGIGKMMGRIVGIGCIVVVGSMMIGRRRMSIFVCVWCYFCWMSFED